VAVDPAGLAEKKRRLRTEMAAEVRARALAHAGEAAEAAARHLEQSVELVRCRATVLYASLPDELPSRPFLELIKRAGREPLFPRMTERGALEMVPCSEWEELSPGRYGVLEPPADRAGRALAGGDLVLIPGIAFDGFGHRLGRGGGYWDRSLPLRRPEGLVLVGVGFACQRVEHVPHGPGDRRVDAVLSEAGLDTVAAPSGA
jgi:5-formyltetrahydrofolate cyclo-ligase